MMEPTQQRVPKRPVLMEKERREKMGVESIERVEM